MDHDHSAHMMSHSSDMDMGHGGTDHGGMGHGDMNMCSMNMLFTWNTENLCIIFRGWHVTNTWSLIFSLIAVMALTAGYEAVREASRRFEMRHVRLMEGVPRGASTAAEEKKVRVVKAAFYGVQVFYSFFIMLLFMTYNGWVMLAVGFGAFFGYLFFGSGSVEKSAACH